jgi:hypothetical protein
MDLTGGTGALSLYVVTDEGRNFSDSLQIGWAVRFSQSDHTHSTITSN